jgi:Na+:H+ antiporter
LASAELVISLFLGVIFLASFVSLRAKIPYTLVLVFAGIVLAATSAGDLLGQTYKTLINQNLFVGIIVSPLIFEAMIHVRSSDLKTVIRPAFVLATAGVAIATLVGGLVLWRIIGLPLNVSFLFSALISPTDAATVLEIFKRVKVPSKLATLMDVEAALNDASAIVIFSTVLTSIQVQGISFFPAVGHFVYVIGGGIVVGIVIAFLGELASSLVSDRVSETLLTISAVYGSYAISSAAGFSGLVSVAIVGLYFGNYTIRTVMGPATRESVALFWQIAAFLANSVAFLFIGINVTDPISLVSALPLITAAFLSMMVARVASVYPILSLFNRLGNKIPRKWQHVATIGGMRGALSIALAASIASYSQITPTTAQEVLTMVLGVAFISLTVQSAYLSRYVTRRFPEEQRVQAEQFNVKLSRAAARIEELQKLKDEGKMSDETFTEELEKSKNELRDVLMEIATTPSTTHVLRSRASGLYSTLITLPKSSAMRVLRLNKMATPIENIIANATGKDNREMDSGGAETGNENRDDGPPSS